MLLPGKTDQNHPDFYSFILSCITLETPDPIVYDNLYRVTRTLLEKGTDTEEIKEHLEKNGTDVILIAVVIKEAKKDHYEKLRKEGFRLIGLGCITGFSGLLITLINFNTTRSIDFAMYGLTTIGISIVFWGLYKIIG